MLQLAFGTPSAIQRSAGAGARIRASEATREEGDERADGRDRSGRAGPWYHRCQPEDVGDVRETGS
jgi:hypothetical protein